MEFFAHQFSRYLTLILPATPEYYFAHVQKVYNLSDYKRIALCKISNCYTAYDYMLQQY